MTVAQGYGLVSYATYLPSWRLSPRDVGGRADRVVASFDEDSTTMAVAALSAALDGRDGEALRSVPALYFATTSPAYADKTNATAIHAALGLNPGTFVTDVVGSGRSAIAAFGMAAARGGAAVCADVRVGLPGSADERGGGDGAAAFVFGPLSESIAHVEAQASQTAEFLDRWRDPAAAAGDRWEERFGLDRYEQLIRQSARQALDGAGLQRADHVVVASGNPAVVKRAAAIEAGAISTVTSPVGFCGATDVGIALAAVLDVAGPGESILVLSAVDGCDAVVLRTTAGLPQARQRTPVSVQRSAGTSVPYLAYLIWRGLVSAEVPRRPEPDRPAAPPSGRSVEWKFGFRGSRCGSCGFAHLPPARVCRSCSAGDSMKPESFVQRRGVVVTYTVDRLAFSPSPPVVGAVVDFDGGGRYTLEVADAAATEISVGSVVTLTFRRLFTAGGVHNYFWKVRTIDPEDGSQGPEGNEVQR